MKIQNIFLILSVLLVVLVAKSEYNAVIASQTNSKIIFNLTYTGKDDYYLKPTSPILKNLIFEINSLAFSDFYFKITDPARSRFQIPSEGKFPYDPLANFSFPINLASYHFSYTLQPFDFKIYRKINNGTLFSTYDKNLIFSEHYMEIGTEVDSQYIYGLGQRFSENFRKTVGKWTNFNRDRGQVIDKGTGLQTYGYYPFYLQREKNKFFHVNYLRNSNAMDTIISQQSGKHYVTFKVIGGTLDFRFILGEQSPQETIQKLHLYMGRAAIPPFWSFGAHQCRWGYKKASDLQDVIDNYKKFDLPLDTIWSDIDYMIDYEDFTIDQSRFPLDKMRAITDDYHYIPIIDAGIKTSGDSYDQGKKLDVYVKTPKGQNLVGKVWPGDTTFVDFFHPNASQYWQKQLDKLFTKVRFSGIWLDMNEYANFCDGPCKSQQGGQFDYSTDLPYQPGSDNIESHTIPLNSTHYMNKSQANVHAFAAMLESQSTNQFLKNKGLRPFIITRSSTFGSNKYSFHWTGDNYASFEYLKGSIADNFNNQLWGMQMVGPDICGFGGNTTSQLCARWYQLATLYPFHRNHNANDAISQQPYALGETVLKAAHISLKLRYSLLKYIFSLFIAKKGLGTIFKPLFFVFPLDSNLYIDDITNTQFMVGANLMAAPIVEQGKTGRNVYFPVSNWYCLYTGKQFKNGTHRIDNVELTDPLPIFLREGTSIFVQSADKVLQTKDLKNNFILIAGFHLDSRRSNDTHKIYNSGGAMLSIKDYSDELKIQQCISGGCQYFFGYILTVNQRSRTLQIDINYGGSILALQQIIIDAVIVYYDGVAVTNKLVNPVIVKGPGKVVVPINQQERGNLKIQQI